MKRLISRLFTISEDKDVGYIAASSLVGSRMNTDLKDTVASLSVLAPEVQGRVATEIPYFRRFAQNITTNQVLSTSEDYNSQLGLVGLTLAGNRKYKMNIFTAYSFSEGMLRRLAAAAVIAIRARSRSANMPARACSMARCGGTRARW